MWHSSEGNFIVKALETGHQMCLNININVKATPPRPNQLTLQSGIFKIYALNYRKWIDYLQAYMPTLKIDENKPIIIIKQEDV